MNWNRWTRQWHRWLAVVFTLTVLLNLAAVGLGEQATWIGILALIPLILLMVTGLYLYFLPHVARWRGREGDD